MARVALIHWKEVEGAPKAVLLRRAGYEVSLEVPGDPGKLRALADQPPDAIIIDLARLPAEGIALGVWFRRRKKTRNVPIVFVGGSADKLARARRLLPDASYTVWERIRRDLRRAIDRKPDPHPVVPGTMAGYSGTPLPKKLGIKEGSIVALLGAPRGFEAKLDPLPDDVRMNSKWVSGTTVAMLFVRSLADYRERLPAAAEKVVQGSRLWIAWPKKASGIETDIKENLVRELGLATGLVDYKICAIDETWSGLCFARRR